MRQPSEGNGIQWNDGPPPRQNTMFYPLVRASHLAAQHFCILSDTVIGVWTHFMEDGSTHPCFHDRACKGCQDKRATRWAGYLACLRTAKPNLVLVEITPDAYYGCPPLHHKKELSLRGCLLTITRAKGKRGKVHCELKPSKLVQSIPALFDVKEALCRIWGIHPFREKGFPTTGPMDHDLDIDFQEGDLTKGQVDSN